MKYIGATDWFIRWPFIIEGIVIGFIGAMIAFIITGYCYNTLENKINNDFLNITSLLKFFEINEVYFQIILVYSVIGVFIGAIGSAVSLRKHLHV